MRWLSYKRPLKEERGSHRTFVTVATVFALLAMVLAVPAQELGTIQNSILSTSPQGERYFDIDMNGDRQGEAELRIDRFLVELRPNILTVARFTGRFHYVHLGPAPPVSSPNVTGTITLIQATPGARTGNAIRIMFAIAGPSSPALGRSRPTQTFEGALRIITSRTDSGVPFIAGEITANTGGVGGAAAGPYPLAGYLLTQPHNR